MTIRSRLRDRGNRVLMFEPLEDRRLLARVTWSTESGGNGHEYEAIAHPIPWWEARNAAIVRGGYLASIGSSAENNFVFGLVNSSAYWETNTQFNISSGPWLGGRQECGPEAEPAQCWVWEGPPQNVFDYTNWLSGEPSNSGLGGEEDCLNFFALSAGGRSSRWNDSACGLLMRGFVIEYDPFDDIVAENVVFFNDQIGFEWSIAGSQLAYSGAEVALVWSVDDDYDADIDTLAYLRSERSSERFVGGYQSQVPISSLTPRPSSAQYLLLVVDYRNFYEENDSNNVLAHKLVDIAPLSVDSVGVDGIQFINGNVYLNYEIANHYSPLATTGELFWSSGPSSSQALALAAEPFTIPATYPPGVYTTIIFASELASYVQRPAAATHLVFRVDPNNRIMESVEDNNEVSATLPQVDLTVVQPGFAWNAADRGGFTFAYNVNDAADFGISDSRVDFYWASGNTVQDRIAAELAFSYALDSTARKSAGEHAVIVTHDMLIPGHRSPPNGATHLVMVIDPDFPESQKVTELDETNNVAALEIVPLVVNIVTHGWNSDGAKWAEYRDILNHIPGDDSILDGRVATYVSNWDSNSYFTLAVVNLALYKILDSVPTLESQLAAELFRNVAQLLARISGGRATAAAYRIANDVREQYLLPPNVSDRLQQIHLVGHSRGAAVNSLVSQVLSRTGYRINQYTALDGFSIDFCADGGLVGDIPIAPGPGAIADRRVNYRVMQGLTTGALDALLPVLLDVLRPFPPWRGMPSIPFTFVDLLFPGEQLPEWARSVVTAWFGEIVAPPRSGFENTLIDVPSPGSPLAAKDDAPTHHMNISERYFRSAGFGNYPDSRKFVLDNVGSSRVDLQACKLEYSIVSPK